MEKEQIEHKGNTFEVTVLRRLAVITNEVVIDILNQRYGNTDMEDFDVWDIQFAQHSILPIYDELIEETNKDDREDLKDEKEHLKEVIELMQEGKIDFFTLEQ